MRTAWMIFAVGALGVSGCALRDAPYRFRAPGVSGVQASALPQAQERDDDDAPRAESKRPASPHLGFAEPTRAPGGAVTEGSPLADTLRAMVGLREPEATGVGFVMTALATLGAALDDDVRAAADGPALVEMARARDATATEHDPLLGDVVVFDGVTRGEAASGLGVVVATRADGTVELVYLARGVVRRGFMNRERPDQKRDAEGRVLNTIMRQRSGSGSKGHGDLTGQVFANYIRLDALSDR